MASLTGDSVAHLGYARAVSAALQNELSSPGCVAPRHRVEHQPDRELLWCVLIRGGWEEEMRMLSWFISLAGLWAAFAPLVQGKGFDTEFLVFRIIPGLMVALFAGLFAIFRDTSLSWLIWVCVLMGLWIMADPRFFFLSPEWALGASGPGLTIAVLSGVVGYRARQP